MTSFHFSRPERGSAAQNVQARRFAASGLTTLFGSVFVLELFHFAQSGDTALALHLTTLAFCAYLFVECRIYVHRSDAYGLVAPPLLASVVTFLISYQLGFVATIYDPWIIDRFSRFLPDLDAGVQQAMMLAMVSAFFMWRGYYVGRSLSLPLAAFLRRSSVIRKSINPNLALCVAAQVVYFALISVAIQLGIYGVSSDIESRTENIELLDLVGIGLAAGTLSFFLIAMSYFDRLKTGRPATGLALLCIALTALHLGAGLLSGFKSQVVMPFVILVIANFKVTNRISHRGVLMTALAFFAAYQIVEPYRSYLRANNIAGAGDVSVLVEALSQSYAKGDDQTGASEIPLSSQIISRFDLLGMSSVAISFVDRGEVSAERRQELQDSIFFSPVLAFVPRALWAEKPVYSTGLWFNQVVLGSRDDRNTSVGMGPVGFLYMAGGLALLISAFFGFGVLQAIMFDGISRAGSGGFIIFLSVATTLILIPSDVGPAITGVWRSIPVAILAQIAFLRGSELRRPTKRRES